MVERNPRFDGLQLEEGEKQEFSIKGAEIPISEREMSWQEKLQQRREARLLEGYF